MVELEQRADASDYSYHTNPEHDDVERKIVSILWPGQVVHDHAGADCV